MESFVDRVEAHLEGVKFFSVGESEECDTCKEYGCCNEFSNSICDSCGTTLAGSRHAAHGVIDIDVEHFEVCVDCLMYHANGEVPEEEEEDIRGYVYEGIDDED